MTKAEEEENQSGIKEDNRQPCEALKPTRIVEYLESALDSGDLRRKWTFIFES